MNSDQKIDYEYHADRLPVGSDQMPALNVEIAAIEDLVRSYWLVSGHGAR
jgi:hypothetical protein